MSTLKTTNIKHASSGSNNIVLDSSGNTTVSGNLTVTGTAENKVVGSYNATAVSVGTAATYTFAAGISADAKIVYLTWDDLSTSAASWIRLRVGTSSAFVTSGYMGQHGYAAGGSGSMQGQQRTTDIPIPHTSFSSAANVHSGMLTLTKHTGNKWIYQGVSCVNGENYFGGFYGSVDVGGDFNRFEFHLEDASAVFDAGTVNCRWLT